MSTTVQQPEALAASLIAAVQAAQIPDVIWVEGDDLCDCTFQRIGWWTNPYIARTLKVRLCCIWEELYAAFPQHVQRIPGFLDYNRMTAGEEPSEEYELVPQPWNGRESMPRALWHRQIQAIDGGELAEIREQYRDEQPPGPRLPPDFYLP